MSEEHASSQGATTARRLALAVGLIGVFAAIEAWSGYWFGSLALLADAGHMATDAAALALSALAAWLAGRRVSMRHSYGFGRAEVLAALVNALFMLAVVTGIVWEALHRLVSPTEVNGPAVIAVAGAGLLVNLVAMHVLSGAGRGLNVRGALLHLFGDIAGSIAAMASGLVIALTGWHTVDPLLSLLVAGLLVVSALRLLRDALHALMEGVPFDISLPEVGRAIAAVPGVLEVHDLHIWMLSGEKVALSAHLRVQNMARWTEQHAALAEMLRERFAITHVTLQPESAVRPLRQVVKAHFDQ
jgi:cobalt-zinc-cadmium efflux system protein